MRCLLKQRLLRPHLWLIRFVGLIVPRRLRADWQQEWEAELCYREALLADWDKLNWPAKLNLLQRSTSAFWDALWLQSKRWEDDMIQDLRYGIRVLLKHPGFSLIIILTLGLGIGANTAIFSIVNAVLLRPLPYEQSEQLMMVFSRTSREARDAVSWADLRDWQAQNQSFADLAAFVPQSVNLTGRAEPGRLIGGFVSANFFNLLKVQPLTGRTFAKSEDEARAERVAIVNYVVWRDRFSADPNLVGQTITLNGQIFTVVGIMPEEFRAPYSEVEVWVPMQHHPNFSPERKDSITGVLGRLKSGVSLQQAQTEMETIAARLADQYPETNREKSVNLIPLQSFLVAGLQAKLWILFAAVGFVLLIACANVANLTLSRAVTRQREMAVRTALGAGRLRIVRQLLTESVMLSLTGGALGLLLGKWGMDALAANSAVNLPPNVTVKLDATVLLFTLGLSLLTGLLFGLFPALRLSRPDLNSTLKDGARTVGASGKRVRDVLVVAQLALALVLLIGAGLMIRSFMNLLSVDPGFDANNVLTLEYRLPANKYTTPEQQWRFHEQVVANVKALPGVQSAAVFFTVPFGAIVGQTEIALPGRAALPADQLPRVQTNRADANYFATMKIPLRSGRVFTAQDQMNTMPVVVINQTLASRYWPNENPLGKQINLPGQKLTATIVGVVGDVKHNSLDDLPQSQLYLAFAQNPHIFSSLAVRTNSDALSFSNAVRNAIWAIDKDQPVWKVRTMEFLVARGIGSQRFIMQLLAALSALALVLAVVGIYGVLSYAVSQQTQAIGVRLALGAQARDILALILKQGMQLALPGIAIGLGVSYGLMRLMRGLLFEVAPADPLTFGLLALLLTLVALLACYLPARRATQVDPLVALRHE